MNTLLHTLPLLGSLWAASGASTAGTAAPALPDQVVQLMDDAEYQQARRHMDRLLRNGKLPLETRVALYAAHALCDVSLGDDATAQQSFQKLLTLQPTYKADPTATSPTVLQVFALTRARMAEQGALESAYQPEFQPVSDVAQGETVKIRVAFKGPPAQGIEQLYVRYRRVGEPNFESAAVPREQAGVAAFAGEVSPTFLQGPEDFSVEYYLDALGSAGERLSGVGTGSLPLSFKVVTKESFTAATAGTSATPRNKGAGGNKLVALVVPFLLGGACVVAVLGLTGGVIALTALQPGASHLLFRWGQPGAAKT